MTGVPAAERAQIDPCLLNQSRQLTKDIGQRRSRAIGVDEDKGAPCVHRDRDQTELGAIEMLLELLAGRCSE